ncbi:transposase [Streptomyces sp. CG 926]|uniref:transposase n=1 Tax=Streptomyces sp. CG 926 TaxID=1882405 RepID=UPI0035BF0B0A
MLLTRCEEIRRKVCEKDNAELRECNGERDHVHLSFNTRCRSRPSLSDRVG